MTEQEKREKAIEKLAQFMCETGEESCAECKGEPDVECAAWNEAVRLYDYILRKAEEVRKETLLMLFDIARNSPYSELELMLLKELIKDEFGVEVDG